MVYKLIGESEEYDNYFVLEKKIEDKRYSFFLSLIQHRFGGWKHASSKEYLSYILEQLSDLEEISFRQMMGEYIIY
jgi:hypothetical protein